MSKKKPQPKEAPDHLVVNIEDYNAKKKDIVQSILERLRNGYISDEKIQLQIEDAINIKMNDEELKTVNQLMQETALKLIEHEVNQRFESESKYVNLKHNHRKNDLLKLAHDMFAQFNDDLLNTNANMQTQVLESANAITTAFSKIKNAGNNDALRKKVEETIYKNLADTIDRNQKNYNLIIASIEKRYKMTIEALEELMPIDQHNSPTEEKKITALLEEHQPTT